MKEITALELKALIDSKSDFQLIDVREEHEFEEDNINGELIPLGTLANNIDKIDVTKKVIIHCRSGARSASAISFIKSKINIDEIYNLQGGIIAFQKL